MSVWVPRTSSSVFARSYSRSHHTLSNYLISSLVRPAVHGLSHSTVYRRQARRLQSTNTSPTSNKNASLSAPATSTEAKPNPPAVKDVPQPPLTTRVWKKVKHEAQHYWHGTKLLVSEVRISSRLQWKILQGETLTRRERRQVTFVPSLSVVH